MIVIFNKRTRKYQEAYDSISEFVKQYNKYGIKIRRTYSAVELVDINCFQLCNTWISLEDLTEKEYIKIMEEQENEQHNNK